MAGVADCHFLPWQGNAESLVVFVHGFLGDLAGTWGSFPELVRDHARCDVMLWSYPTHLLGHAPAVDGVGTWLLSRLRTKCANYRNLVLVGHSLGCLVIESLIVLELRDAHATERPVSQIRHVLMYAPPHGGSPRAGFFAAIPNAQLRLLGTGNKHLIGLQREWVNSVYRPDSTLAPGTMAQIPMTIVGSDHDGWVPRAFAQFVYSDTSYRALNDRDHISIKLPTGANDLSFQILREIVDALP
jgi:pimeloyl-ACP methyl ester carboxylesterase